MKTLIKPHLKKRSFLDSAFFLYLCCILAVVLLFIGLRVPSFGQARSHSTGVMLFRQYSTQETARLNHVQHASKLASEHFSSFSVLDLDEAQLQRISKEKQAFDVQMTLGTKSPKPITMHLEPYYPFSPNAQMIAKTPSGDVPITLEEEFAIFRGKVIGDEHSRVFCSISSRGVMMTIHTNGVQWTIEPISRADDATQSRNSIAAEQDYALYSSSDKKHERQFMCGTEEFSEHEHLGEEHENDDESHNGILNDKNGAEVHSTRVCEMGIDIDFATFQSLGSNQAQAAQYGAAVIAAVSQIFERDVQTRLVISHVQVWTASDPYASANNTGTALNQFRGYWNSNNASVNRDLAHLLSVRGLGGGIAYLDALCNQSIGYGVSANLRATFPIDPGWTTIVVAHEIGHNFGSWHTHSCRWEGGAIDRCAPAESVPGQAPCFTSTVRSRGTIMSYCHLYPGGTANIDVNFHPLCAARMISRAAAASCLGTTSSGGGGGTTTTLGAAIQNITPVLGGAGTSVTITGVGFTNVTGVRFGGVNAQSFTVNNSTQITAVVGSGATGNVQVISGNSFASSSQIFEFSTNVTASSATLSFPATRVNSTVTLTVSLRNNDNVSIPFLGTSISGANAGDFSVVASSVVTNASLPAKATQTLTILYRPSGVNTRSAILNVMYQGKPNAQVNLFGAVDISPLLELSTRQITTASVNLGETSAPVMYELRGEYLSSGIIITATGDIEISRSSSATAVWTQRMDISNEESIIKIPMWVRHISRRDGIVSGTISHWSGTSNVILTVNSFTNISSINTDQTLEFTRLQVGQTGISSYNLLAQNVVGNLSIQAPSGCTLAFDDNGPWQTSMNLSPVERTISTKIYVRFVASTHGTFSGIITHRIGSRSSQTLVRAVIPRSPLFIQSVHQSDGRLQFGYVPVRQSSMATYWLNITNATTPITITAPQGFMLALEDNGQWAEQISVSPKMPNVRQIVFVRFSPRSASIFSDVIHHSFNGTNATLAVVGSSRIPTLGITPRIMNFGNVTNSTIQTRTYRIDADGITSPIHISLPKGVEASLSEFGGWSQSLVITPRLAQAAVQVLVRTTGEFKIGVPVRDTIRNVALESGALVTENVLILANQPQAFTNALPNNGNINPPEGMMQNTDFHQQTTNVRSSMFGLEASVSELFGYPNPFQDNVSFTWKQRESGQVIVQIRAANGALVRTLMHTGFIGEQRVQWDGRDANGQQLSNGAYFGQVLVNGMLRGNVSIILAR